MAAKIAISFLTYNRAKHIEEDLEAIAQETLKKDIDIYIFDGSTDRETEMAAGKYMEQGYHQIHYRHYENEAASRFQRTKDALLSPDAEYIWFCGDNFVVHPKYYDDILKYVDLSYDIITIYDKSVKETKSYSNPADYVIEAMVPFTHYGAVIIRKELLLGLDVHDRICQLSPTFWVMLLYMRAIDKTDFNGAVIRIALGQLRIRSKYVTKSESDAHMWDVWIKNWYLTVTNMPDRYDEIKEAAFHKIDKDLHFFGWKALLLQRAEGQFDKNKCIEYKEYVSKVVLLPYWIVYLISIMPEDKIRQILELRRKLLRRPPV